MHDGECHDEVLFHGLEDYIDHFAAMALLYYIPSAATAQIYYKPLSTAV